MELKLRTVLMSLGVLGLGLHPAAAQSILPMPVKKEFSAPSMAGIGPAAEGAFADIVQASHQALPDTAPVDALEAGLQALVRKQAGGGSVGAVEPVQAPAAAAPLAQNATAPEPTAMPAPATTIAPQVIPQPSPATQPAPSIAEAQPAVPQVQPAAAAANAMGEQSSAWATAYLPQTGAAALPQAGSVGEPVALPSEPAPAEPAPEAVAAIPQAEEPALPAQPEPQTSAPDVAVAAAGSISEKARECIAIAVYFEARKQSEEIQRAVVQVILNRVSSGKYPQDICETVFQDQYVKGGCQFAFTCDGRSETIRDQEAWNKAQEAVERVTSGQAWSDEVAGATHYHAPGANPGWLAEVQEVGALDGYSFYRKS